MKFSQSWLSEYVPIADGPDRFGERLTSVGFALEGRETTGDGGPEGGDVIYDLEIPANRPDCMSHVGLAREYATIVRRALKAPAAAIPPGGPPTAEVASVRIEDPGLCGRYAARCVLGLRVGASPEWLRRRLAAIGQDPINNVVDATNFVLWEIGQPLHAFDLDRLEEHRIVVRLARPGETLVTLDGSGRVLSGEMLVIADARRPVAIAGVMGGRGSEITPGTRRILIESAWFDPVSVRRTSRALGLRTDASHRFERGADPAAARPALDRAASLIAAIAGGTITDPPIDEHPRPEPPRVLGFRPARAASLLGYAPPAAAMVESLTGLGFAVARRDEARWEVAVPSFRRDVEREADLIEEVARHGGYDAIPSLLPLLPDAGSGRRPEERRARAARAAMLAAGLSEAFNYSMVDGADCAPFDAGAPGAVALENPLQSQSACLRTSLLPGLLRNVAHNLNHGVPRCALFEIGTVFRPGPARPDERLRLAFVLAGRGLPVHWSLPHREADLYDARGAVELLGERLGLSPLAFSSDRIPFLAPGSSLRLAAADQTLGVLGEIAPAVRARFGIERGVFGAEIDLDAMVRIPARERLHRPLPRFPAARRDLALLVGSATTFEVIERAVRDAAGGVPIAEVQVFDRYRGPGVPDGQVSVAIQIVFQHPQRTLAAEEVQAAQDAIVSALRDSLGARLRGAPQD